MADFVILFNTDTGEPITAWSRTTSDNSATFIADDKLTVDGVDVAVGFAGVTNAAVVVLTDPTFCEASAPMFTMQFDDPWAPGDIGARGVAGARDPVYYEDRDEFGIMLEP